MKKRNVVCVGLAVLVLTLLLFMLTACAEDAEQIAQSSNPNVKVEQLLTVEGYKVFRFEDGGHFIYFVIPSGSTHWSRTVSTGKSAITYKHDVYTGDPIEQGENE